MAERTTKFEAIASTELHSQVILLFLYHFLYSNLLTKYNNVQYSFRFELLTYLIQTNKSITEKSKLTLLTLNLVQPLMLLLSPMESQEVHRNTKTEVQSEILIFYLKGFSRLYEYSKHDRITPITVKTFLYSQMHTQYGLTVNLFDHKSRVWNPSRLSNSKILTVLGKNVLQILYWKTYILQHNYIIRIMQLNDVKLAAFVSYKEP